MVNQILKKVKLEVHFFENTHLLHADKVEILN